MELPQHRGYIRFQSSEREDEAEDIGVVLEDDQLYKNGNDEKGCYG